MNIRVVTPPAKLPVTVAEVRSHLRIDIDDDDLDIEKKIKASVSGLDPPDGRLGRALISQTLRWSLAEAPRRMIHLPYPPVRSIASVKYLSSSDVETTVSPATYALRNDQEPAVLVLKEGYEWPSDLSGNDPFPFKINFVAGYGDNPGDVPESIRLGIMMEVGDFYLQRENVVLGQSLAQNEFTRRIFDNYIWRP